MEDLRIIAGAAIVAAALALLAASRWFGRQGRTPGVVAVAAALEVAIWVPPHARDWALAITAMLLVFAGMGSRPGAAVCLGLLIGALILSMGAIPGGPSAMLLGIVAAASVGRVRAGLRHLARVRRAAALRPGHRPRGDVQIGGQVAGRPVEVPLHPGLEAAWWAVIVDGDRRATSGLLRLDTEAGPVFADAAGGRIDMKQAHSMFCPCRDHSALAALVGPLEDREERGGPPPPDVHYTVYWLEPGADAYVVGTPAWDRAPAELGGYRDAPVVPVFRGERTYVTDLSSREAQADARWCVAAWSVWGAVCGAVAGLQLAGLL